ncbi:two-component system histidine kinase PnpS [Heyndrickxia ginsengihumi]|uniref:histidine kinase n=1 Tax=Heyndrickxia ginsengihumi TaxID=363870 RepID=A0A0A6VFU0_9BACI|nr:ATP-binding protein [Heyndrickxia ginsengihumi]KHD86446.1 histidine kinase [Heyndrickxia ginsengihumi]MBE6184282.1 cell wall metabolism sensor histidine kinase WalK [Bacillus sp. (in: firmicutes)]NEY19191.1 cell wall metabolism sensor histidine kinase WalK [Heyndrickxia ginsengihumi]
MNKLWIRITFTFLTLLAVVLLTIGLFIADLVKNTYMDMTRTQLAQDAKLLSKTMNIEKLSKKPGLLQEKIAHNYSTYEPRVTIINLNGKVLADSYKDPTKMENHANRPEFREVVDQHLSRGESIRPSKTLGYSMLYVAHPLKYHGKTVAVVRIAISLEKIETVLRRLWISLACALLIAFVIAAIIGFRIAKRFTRPIEASIEVSTRLMEKDYDSRVHVKASGELKQLTGAINDLAENLKQQMDEIKENQQRLTAVLENMVSGVMLIDATAQIVLVNRAMEKLTGMTSAQLIGKRHIEAWKNFGLSQLIDYAFHDRKSMHDEVHLYYPTERILDAHVAPYLDDKGSIKGIVTVLHDITDIRRLEKIRSEFVANVSHELKTPITSIKGFAETLLDGAIQDEETCQSFLKIIYDESDRLHRLISDILDLSKIEQHRIPLKVHSLDLIQVIHETIATTQERIQAKQLTVLLPTQHEVMMEADKDRLQQIILNLVTNAIAYTPEKGLIQIEVQERTSDLDLIVRDTGIGISETDLPRIFERFYRVDKARSRQSGGTGLGLAIVKHLVESSQGKIAVQSEEGKGTTFTITLPKKQKV